MAGFTINFECHALCMSLKKDVNVDLYPPLFMATLSITEVDVLKILELILIVNLLLYLELYDELAIRSHQ